MLKITNRYHENPFKPQTTNQLLGNVGDWQALTIDVEASVSYEATNNEPVIFNLPNMFSLTNGKSWRDYGFQIGDDIILRWEELQNNNGLVFNRPFTIIDIQFSDLIVSPNIISSDANTNLLPGQTVIKHLGQTIDIKKFNARFLKIGDHPFESVISNYNFLLNSNFQSASLQSVIDGEETRLQALGLESMLIGDIAIFEKLKNQSGMSVSSAELEYLSKNTDSDVTNHYIYSYRVTIIYLITALYDDKTDIESLTPPDWFLGSETLTESFDLQFRPDHNDPNVSVQLKREKYALKGNVGWFNENYNGLQHGMTVDSVEYRDTLGNLIDRLDHSKPTIISGIIRNVPDVTPIPELAYMFSLATNEENLYKNKIPSNHENLKINTWGVFKTFYADGMTSNVIPDAQGFSSDDARMDSNSFYAKVIPSTNDVEFSVELIPTTEFYNYIENRPEDERNYVFSISVASRSLVTNYSDRVSLLVDYNYFEENIEPIGEYDYVKTSWLKHNNSQFDIDLLNTDLASAWLEDAIVWRHLIAIDKTSGSILNEIECSIEVENTPNDDYLLDNVIINTSQFPIDSNNVQLINIDDSRGFLLPNNDKENYIKVQRETSLDSGNYAVYSVFYGTKVRWEYFVERFDVPQNFVNSLKENNGKFNDWDWFQEVANKLKSKIYLTFEKNGEIVKYENSTNCFNDSNGNGVLGFFELSGVQALHSIDGVDSGLNYYIGQDSVTSFDKFALPVNESVYISIIFERVDGNGWTMPISNYFAKIRIKVFEKGGIFTQNEISNIRAPRIDNPLKPISGNIGLELTVISPYKIMAKCVLDTSNLGSNEIFKISSNIQSIENIVWDDYLTLTFNDIFP